MDQVKNIALYFRKWDPLGLLQSGFPEDEYDLSASELLWWFEKNESASSQEVAAKAYDIIVDRMLGEESKTLRTDALRRASDIKGALIKDVSP